jgi:hypothetical protein
MVDILARNFQTLFLTAFQDFDRSIDKIKCTRDKEHIRFTMCLSPRVIPFTPTGYWSMLAGRGFAFGKNRVAIGTHEDVDSFACIDFHRISKGTV